MAIAPHIAALRRHVGTGLLLLPSVAVLPWDAHGRLLLVREADSGQWATVGGAVEVDEHPEEAAVREAREETGLEVELTGLRGVLGGPNFRITYANGDRTAYVSTVYDARVEGGVARPDQEETTDLAWVAREDLAGLALGGYARASLRDLGLL